MTDSTGLFNATTFLETCRDKIGALGAEDEVSEAARKENEKLAAYEVALNNATLAFNVTLRTRSYYDEFDLNATRSFKTPYQRDRINSYGGRYDESASTHHPFDETIATPEGNLEDVKQRYIHQVLNKLAPDVLWHTKVHLAPQIRQILSTFFGSDAVRLDKQSPWTCLLGHHVGDGDMQVFETLIHVVKPYVSWGNPIYFDKSNAKTLFLLLDLARAGFSNICTAGAEGTGGNAYSMVDLLLSKGLERPYTGAQNVLSYNNEDRSEALNIITEEDKREHVKKHLAETIDSWRHDGSRGNEGGSWKIRPDFANRYSYTAQRNDNIDRNGVFENAVVVLGCHIRLLTLHNSARLATLYTGLGERILEFTIRGFLTTLSTPMRVHADLQTREFVSEGRRLDKAMFEYLTAVKDSAEICIHRQLKANRELVEYGMETGLLGASAKRRSKCQTRNYDDSVMRGSRIVSTHLKEDYFAEFADSIWIHGTYEFLYDDPVDATGSVIAREEAAYVDRMKADSRLVAAVVYKFVAQKISGEAHTEIKWFDVDNEQYDPSIEYYPKYPHATSRILVPISIKIKGSLEAARQTATRMMDKLYPVHLDHFEYLSNVSGSIESDFAPVVFERALTAVGAQKTGLASSKLPVGTSARLSNSVNSLAKELRERKKGKQKKTPQPALNEPTQPSVQSADTEDRIHPGVRQWKVKWWAGDASLAIQTPLPSRMSKKQIHEYTTALTGRDATPHFDAFNDEAMPLIHLMDQLIGDFLNTTNTLYSDETAIQTNETIRIPSLSAESNKVFDSLMYPDNPSFYLSCPLAMKSGQHFDPRSNIFELFLLRPCADEDIHNSFLRKFTRPMTKEEDNNQNLYGRAMRHVFFSRNTFPLVVASTALMYKCDGIINDLYRMGVLYRNIDTAHGVIKRDETEFVGLRTIDQNEFVARRPQTYMSNVINCVRVLKQERSDAGVVIDALESMTSPGQTDDESTSVLPSGLYDLFDALETSGEFLSNSVRFLNTLCAAFDQRRTPDKVGKALARSMTDDTRLVLTMVTEYMLELSDDFYLQFSRLVPAARSRTDWFDAGFYSKENFIDVCKKAIDLLDTLKRKWNVGKLGVFIAIVGRFANEFETKKFENTRVVAAAKWIKTLTQRVADINLHEFEQKFECPKLNKWLEDTEKGYVRAAAALHTSAMMANFTSFANQTPSHANDHARAFDTIRAYDGTYNLHWTRDHKDMYKDGKQLQRKKNVAPPPPGYAEPDDPADEYRDQAPVYDIDSEGEVDYGDFGDDGGAPKRGNRGEERPFMPF